ncbi:MAG TPA: GNAT family N-acetyltransferase [Anaerolineaceae bacterium]|nr:GNAT family N-acetyltransferase [Anaerolineaceae bacterium]
MNFSLGAEVDYLTADGEQIHIRPLVDSDLEALEWEGEFKHFHNLYAQHYASSLQGATLIWVAETCEKKVVGQVFILLNSKQSDVADGKSRAYLFSFRIRPQWRNLGIGGYLLNFVENELASRGFIWLRLNVAKDNPHARRMYEKHGYKVIGSDPGDWSYQDDKGVIQHVKEPAWKMIKRLR